MFSEAAVGRFLNTCAGFLPPICCGGASLGHPGWRSPCFHLHVLEHHILSGLRCLGFGSHLWSFSFKSRFEHLRTPTKEGFCMPCELRRPRERRAAALSSHRAESRDYLWPGLGGGRARLPHRDGWAKWVIWDPKMNGDPLRSLGCRSFFLVQSTEIHPYGVVFVQDTPPPGLPGTSKFWARGCMFSTKTPWREVKQIGGSYFAVCVAHFQK